MKRVLGTVLALIMVLQVALWVHDSRGAKSRNAVVRLHLPNGLFFCSGTVISKHMILTAAHCLEGAPMHAPIIEIRRADGAETGIMAAVQAVEGTSDTAILVGNFESFPQMRLEWHISDLEASYLTSKHEVEACGYPHGGRLYCTPVKDIQMQLFSFIGRGLLYRGMSGGPVIDKDTNKIIGVNTAVEGDHLILSPTAELFELLGISENLYLSDI